MNWDYDTWPSRNDLPWGPDCERGSNEHDLIDFHVDLGCGTRPKARIGIDRFEHPAVDLVMDLDAVDVRLPFADSSIQSVISHHFFEHVGEGFIPLVDEIYRVLRPGGILRAITPLFPSTTAVEDPDHCRYFMAHDGGGGTWDAFCGKPGVPHWTESFSVPYTKARFTKVHQDLTPRVRSDLWWSPYDCRELRVALRAEK